MLVTNLQYYMDDNLKALIDLFIKRKEKDYDNVIIIDGKERIGKTTLAKSIAYYYAKETGKEFNLDHIFFNPEKMLEFATTHRQEVIVWDEASFGGLSIQWQNKIQQKLNGALMTTGKYNHFYIFVIPSFFRLNRYLAIDRSIGLIHCFSPDLIERGMFACYNENQKVWIYNSYRKTEHYGKSCSFRGRWTLKNTETIVNEAEYELKKDNAIHNFLNQSDIGKSELNVLKNRIATLLPLKEAMEIGNISRKTYFNWKNIA